MSTPLLSTLKRLGARYDLAALQPPEPAFAAPATQAQAQAHPAWPALQAWCRAGDGALQPRPLHPRLTVAVLEGGTADVAHTLAQALCLERDGSLQMLACHGAAGRLALRLKTKLHDITPWRPRQPTDAWDAGFVRGTAAGLQALARFQPRRATLLVAQGLGAPALRATCASLQAREAGLGHAVRLLLITPATGLDLGRAVTRIAVTGPLPPV